MTYLSSFTIRIFLLMAGMLCWAAPLHCLAQVSIPDTAFLRYLKKEHKSTIDANNKLVLSEALKLTSLYHDYSNTVSLEGIQYFKNLQFLSVHSGKLRYLPSLDSLKNLKKLTVQENELDSLPSLKGLSKLTYLACYDNKIKQLPAFPDNAIIDTLTMGINLFENIDAVSELTQLADLGAWSCQLKRAPDLSKLVRLTSLSLGSNRFLTALPDLSVHTQLQNLNFDNNNFSQMPNLWANVNLKYVKFQHNTLSFEDILPYVSHPNFAVFEYAPQDSLGRGETYIGYEGKSFNYDLGIDRTITSNVYKLYKDGVLLSTSNSGTINISSVSLSDRGAYHFEISNPGLKNLVLYSKPVYLQVVPKLDASALSYTVQHIQCNNLGAVKVNHSSISGGTWPYTVNLIAAMGKDTLSENAVGQITELKEEKYHVLVTDALGNKVLLTDKIRLQTNYENCDPLVITPNGDGHTDALYIATAGKIRVFDRQGLLVKEMNGPSYWDASNAKGETVTSGYYIISTPQESIKVSVVW